MHRFFAASLLATSALAVSATAPAQAGGYEFVSQSVIVMRGIPPRKGKATPAAPKGDVVEAAAANDAVQTLTAEERRLLRYGLAEENKEKLSQAERRIEPAEEAAEPAQAAEDEPSDLPPPPMMGDIEPASAGTGAGGAAAGGTTRKASKSRTVARTARKGPGGTAGAERQRARQNRAEEPQLPRTQLDAMRRESARGPDNSPVNPLDADG